jgi:hypothetical protein
MATNKQTFREWTFVGIWEDTRESWVDFGSGDTLDEAVKDALDGMIANDPKRGIDQLTILAVFEGRQTDYLQEPVSATVAYDRDTDLDHCCDDDCRSYGCGKGNPQDAKEDPFRR